MKSLLLLCCVLFFGSALQAQQYQFIYLQTDNKQPFYVRVNEKLYSSSAAGYLVIPKLKDGMQNLSVGFPKNEWPAQNLNVNIAGKDLGFLLKPFDNNKWGLFNLQTMEVVKVTDDKKTEVSSTTTSKTDQFSNILADVVNTPSIKEEKKEVVKQDPTPEVPKPAPAPQPVVETVAVAPAVVEPGVKEINAAVDIRKLSSTTDTEGLVMVYVDKMREGTDTIQIFIEAPKKIIQEMPAVKQVVVAEKLQEETKTVTAAVSNDPSAPKFIDITLTNPNEKVTAGEEIKEQQSYGETKTTSSTANESVKPLMINSDCKQLATEADFLKIRKKMTAEKDEDGMVKAATRMFKQKCYSTEQVKNLSVLFLKDEGKYKLFDAAYPHIHDTQSFKQLESQLTDTYIITRFRAMIRN